MIGSRIAAAALAALIAGSALPASADTHIRSGLWPYGGHFKTFCFELTDYQLRKAIKAKGYSNIYLNARDSHRIQVRATKGSWVYLLRVNTCDGSILERNRLRHS
jgi:hypothetical protein